MASYIEGMGEFEEGEQKTFIAALISMAIKGLIEIREVGQSAEIIRKDAPGVTVAGKKTACIGGQKPAGGREGSVQGPVLTVVDTVKLADMEYKQMSKIMSAFTSAVDKETDETYYHENMGRSFIGLLITVVSVALYFLLKSFWAPPFEFPILEVMALAFFRRCFHHPVHGRYGPFASQARECLEGAHSGGTGRNKPLCAGCWAGKYHSGPLE